MPSYDVEIPQAGKFTVQSDSEISNEQAYQYALAQHQSEQGSIDSSVQSEIDNPQGQKTSKSGHEELLPSFGRGVVKGGQGMMETAVNANELLAKLIGKTPITPFGEAPQARQFLNESKSGLDKLIPPPETITGKISEGIGQFPGMFLQFENPLARAVGPVKVAAGLGAINAQEGGPWAMAGNALMNAGQMAVLGAAQKMNPVLGAITGAAATGLPAAMQGDNKDAIAQAALGATFSLYHPDTMTNLKGMFSAANGIAKNPMQKAALIMRALEHDPVTYQKNKLADREDRLKQIQASVAPGFAKELQKRSEELKAQTQEEQQVLKAQRTTADDARSAYEGAIDDKIHAATESIQNAMQDITGQIPGAAISKTRELQSRMKSLQDQANKQYGAVFDSAAKRVDANSPVSIDFAAGSYSDILKQASNEGRPATDPLVKKVLKEAESLSTFDPVSEFYRKYAKTEVGGRSGGIEPNGPYGKQLEAGVFFDPKIQNDYNVAKATADEPIPFKEFYGKAKSIWDAHPEDHLASELKSGVGDFISKVDPEFRSLQNEYREFASFRNKARGVIKPFEGPAYTEGGEQLFNRVASGKTSGTDQQLLNFLETGYQGKHLNIQGFGDISSTFKTMSEKLAQYDKHLDAVKDRAYGVYGKELTQIARAHADEIARLSQANQMTTEKFEEMLLRAERDIENRKVKVLEELHGQKEILRQRKIKLGKIETSEKIINGISNSLVSVLRATGFYHASWAARSALSVRRALRATSKLSFSRSKR